MSQDRHDGRNHSPHGDRAARRILLAVLASAAAFVGSRAHAESPVAAAAVAEPGEPRAVLVDAHATAVAGAPEPLARPAKSRVVSPARAASPHPALPAEAPPGATPDTLRRGAVPADSPSPRLVHAASIPVRGPPDPVS